MTASVAILAQANAANSHSPNATTNESKEHLDSASNGQRQRQRRQLVAELEQWVEPSTTNQALDTFRAVQGAAKPAKKAGRVVERKKKKKKKKKTVMPLRSEGRIP
uniref:Uncharacterized protein n=1 Tax=Prorocentrum micans TaxID=2945 RepID=A0A7S2X6I0_PROMC